MTVDVNVDVVCRDGQIEIGTTLTNTGDIGENRIAVYSFDLVFSDGSTVDTMRGDTPRTDIAGFNQYFLAGRAVWFRAQVRYKVEQARTCYLIKDFCFRLGDNEQIIEVACLKRVQEAMGMLAYWAQDLSTAAQHFEIALSEYESEQCRFAFQAIMQTHAYVLLVLGRLDEASFHTRLALNMSTADGMTITRLKLLGNLANVQLKQKQARAARATFEQVLEIATKLNVRHNIGIAEAGIGSSYKIQGNIVKAEKWLRRAVASARTEEDWLGLSRRMHTLGTVLGDTKRFQESASVLAESLSLALDIRDFEYLENICKNLDRACEKIGDSNLFVTTCEKLLEVLPEHLEIETRLHVLIALGSEYAKVSNFSLAIERSRAALDIARENSDLYAQMISLSNLGGHYALTNQFDRAEESFRKAMKLASSLNAWGVVEQLKTSLAKVLSVNENTDIRVADAEYTKLLTDWWFSQPPPDE